MTGFSNSVDERTRVAGANRLEAPLFSLGEDTRTARNEVFGINVLKVREVMHVPEIARAPHMPEAVEGIASQRGTMVPVINLQSFCRVSCRDRPNTPMVTDYYKHVQGFLIDAVETIGRLSREEVKTPPPVVTSRIGGLVTAVAELSRCHAVPAETAPVSDRRGPDPVRLLPRNGPVSCHSPAGSRATTVRFLPLFLAAYIA